MVESTVKPGQEEEEEEEEEEEDKSKGTMRTRKEKRKEKKKKRRKQKRREIAEKEREEGEARLNDPEEQKRLKEIEEEERQKMERDRKEFEDRERKFLEEIERQRKLLLEQQEKEEEEMKTKKAMEDEKNDEKLQVEKEDECNDDCDLEYVEEGPAEIIWQGNEITVRKKRVKVPKKQAENKQSRNEDDRPTSNPLLPQSETFSVCQNVSMVSAQELLENVAQQLPNFGTEQDKAHCPFHLKTGACRFGQRCSRVHFYPDKACTLLMKNMYNGPGLACEQDEGLEYTDEEVEHCYEEFYEDVHTEFLKYGEIVNFKVCKNSSFHLRGNVYVQYKSLDSAVLACHATNGRYFAGRQVNCEFVNVTRWKVAICGEYMKSRLKMCSRGMACNFIHCFRNPGGDYEWADWDKPPPRYWVKKMTALFGYSDDFAYERHAEPERFEQTRMSGKRTLADAERHRPCRSRSRDKNHLHRHSGNSDDEVDGQGNTQPHWHTDDDQKEIRAYDEKSSGKNCRRSDRRSHDPISDEVWSDRVFEADRERHGHHGYETKRSKHHDEVTKCSTDLSGRKSKDRNYKADSDVWAGGRRNRRREHPHAEGSECREKVDPNGDRNNKFHERSGYQSGSEKHDGGMMRSSRHHSKVWSMDDLADGKESYREKSSDRHTNLRRKKPRHYGSSSEFLDDYQDDRNRTHHDTDSGNEDNDKERHRRHKRRCSRHRGQQISDDEEITSKRSKEVSYNEETEVRKSHAKMKSVGHDFSRWRHSSRKSVETKSSFDSWNSSENCKFDGTEPGSPHKSFEETDEQEDRWKPGSPASLEFYSGNLSLLRERSN